MRRRDQESRRRFAHRRAAFLGPGRKSLRPELRRERDAFGRDTTTVRRAPVAGEQDTVQRGESREEGLAMAQPVLPKSDPDNECARLAQGRAAKWLSGSEFTNSGEAEGGARLPR